MAFQPWHTSDLRYEREASRKAFFQDKQRSDIKKESRLPDKTDGRDSFL